MYFIHFVRGKQRDLVPYELLMHAVRLSRTSPKLITLDLSAKLLCTFEYETNILEYLHIQGIRTDSQVYISEKEGIYIIIM